MPLFDFRCGDCGEVSEVLLRERDASPEACPACGGTDMKKMPSTFNTPRNLPPASRAHLLRPGRAL